MKTIILPGYSLHNKEWAAEIAKNLELKTNNPVIVHQWRHWKSGGSLSLKYEIKKILEETADEKFNLIAKSVGTMVAMHLLPKIPEQIDKIILCGIPSVSEERLGLFQEALVNFPSGKIVIFQNIQDPFASFQEVKEFIQKVNLGIKVIEKPRSDHHYPYLEDFWKFLI